MWPMTLTSICGRTKMIDRLPMYTPKPETVSYSRGKSPVYLAVVVSINKYSHLLKSAFTLYEAEQIHDPVVAANLYPRRPGLTRAIAQKRIDSLILCFEGQLDDLEKRWRKKGIIHA